MDSYCDHYLNTIGFDKIYLFEDKGSYSHKPFVEKFGDRVVLTPLPELPNKYYEGKLDTCVRQVKLYTWFLEQHKKDYDWVAFFDDDEYMVLPKGMTLCQLLEKHNNHSALYLYWDVLRTDDIDEPKCSYLEQTNYYRYLKFEYNVEIKYKIKSIVNTRICNDILSVHYADKNGVDVFGNTFDELKKYYRIDNLIDYNDLHTIPYIKHFYLRSFETFFRKIMLRGDMTFGHRKISEWFIGKKISEEEKQNIVRSMMIKYNIPIFSFGSIVDKCRKLKQKYS